AHQVVETQRLRASRGDDPSAKDATSGVEHCSLAWCSTQKRLVQGDPAGLIQRRNGRRVIAQARLAADHLRNLTVDEAHLAKVALASRQLFLSADHQPVRGR